MGDLKSVAWIKAKGILFLLGGFLGAALLVMEHPEFKTIALLALTVWCFCRFYYFAFYVIEHYVDPSSKFAGLFNFAVYLIRGHKT
jgi:hypothetical protein